MRPRETLEERIAKLVVIEHETQRVTVRLVFGQSVPLGLKVHAGARTSATRHSS